MTATSTPFGFSPIKNGINARGVGLEQYTIASAYASNIFSNDPVKNAGDGTMAAAGNTDHMFGMFQGCEYTTSDNYYRIRAMWTASQALFSGTSCLAYIIRDPFMEYQVQASGSLAITSVGFGADMVLGAGNTTSGFSNSQLNTALGSGTTSKGFRITGLYGAVNNAWGDSFTIVKVVMNNMSGFLPMGNVTSWV